MNGKKQIPLQELICQPFILTEKEMSYRRMLSEYLASCSLEIQPVFEVGNTELICRMLGKERFRNLASAGLCDRKGRTGKKTGAAGCERFSA